MAVFFDIFRRPTVQSQAKNHPTLRNTISNYLYMIRQLNVWQAAVERTIGTFWGGDNGQGKGNENRGQTSREPMARVIQHSDLHYESYADKATRLANAPRSAASRYESLHR